MVPTTLPAELELFRGFDQWVLWALIEGRGKVPVNTTGFPIDSQDSANWQSFEHVAGLANANGLNAGFVFTRPDPFFFVDVDHAWDGTQWNEVAGWARAALPGAACELSQSGTGFHMFGLYRSIIEHSNKRIDLGVEFYTEGRFCAMTFANLEGGPIIDLTVEANAFAAYFPPKAAGDAIAWSTEPDPTWRGPTDDEELIAKMLAAPGGVKRAFGGAATFRQLWEGDADALAVAYPDPTRDDGGAYGANEADAALCAHLAFWTGRHCERIERLFSRSELGQRDKWIDRAGYRQSTIEFAVSSCTNVYSQPAPASTIVDPLNPPQLDELAPFNTGLATLPIDGQWGYFNGCVWISDAKRIFTPRGLLLDREQFDVAYSGTNFEMEIGSHEVTKSPFECFTKSRALSFPKADTSGFKPLDPPGYVYPAEHGGGLIIVNTYAPARPVRARGDVAPFLDYCQRIWPGELNRTIALSYMQSAVQNPGVKFQYCLFLQGVQGTGKTFLTEVLTSAIGREDYVTSANVDDVGNKFNANFYRKLLIIIEECNAFENPGLMSALKVLITNRRIEFQPKRIDQFTGDNCANFILTANSKRGIMISANDRRYAPVYLAQQTVADLIASGLTEEYFGGLWYWYDHQGGRAAVNDWLLTTEPVAQFNPAGAAKRAPRTENTEEAIAVGVSEIAMLISEACAEGIYGMNGPWISTAAINAQFANRPGFDRRKIADTLVDLGYEKHRGLKDGRVPAAIPGEGKTRLWVLAGSPAAALEGNAIIEAYLKAQNHIDTMATGAQHGT